MKYLRQARRMKGVSQQETADYLGITRQAYSNYETDNRSPDFETLLKLAEYFDTSVDFLLRGQTKTPAVQADSGLSDEAMRLARMYDAFDAHGREMVNVAAECERRRLNSDRADSKVVYLNHSIQKASAGTGFELDYEQMERWGVEYNDLTRRADYCVTVSGDSMEPMYYDEDVVLVKATQAVDVGEIGLFVVDGKGYIKKQGVGQLISVNQDYDDIVLNPYLRVDCVGRVLGVLKPEWIVDKDGEW